MNPEQENFEALQRLLKLKRHEQPPPRYFNDFSSQVIMRIKVGGEDKQESFFEFLSMEALWVQRLLGAFETKPAVAWMFGLSVCALVVSGVVYSETVEYTPESGLPVPVEVANAQAMANAPLGFGQSSTEPMIAFAGSTNATIQPGGSIFDQIQPSTLPASFSFR